MGKGEVWDKGGLRYEAVEPQPELAPGRAWLSPVWKRPGPPEIPDEVRFFPDYHAALPLWGIDWYNPPLSRILLQALCDWQDAWEEWDESQLSDSGWAAWLAEGDRLGLQVQAELGPTTVVELSFLEKARAEDP